METANLRPGRNRYSEPEKNEADIPVCGPAAVSKHPNRVFIVDSGTTTNVMCEKIAQNTLRDFVRNTRFRLEFDTANSSVTTSEGLRAQIGTWDKAADYVLMKDSPELISVGERVMFAGFSNVWITSKHPCFISEGGQYIIIFDLDNGLLPIWSPDMEQSDEFLGTFEFWNNCFRDRCGIYINSVGEVSIDIPAPPNYVNRFVTAAASKTSIRQPTVAPSGTGTVGAALTANPSAWNSSGASAAGGQTETAADEVVTTTDACSNSMPNNAVPAPVDSSGASAARVQTGASPDGFVVTRSSGSNSVSRIGAPVSVNSSGASAARIDEQSAPKEPAGSALVAEGDGDASVNVDETVAQVAQGGIEETLSTRVKARSKCHLLDHAEFNPECAGCQAKARNKKHFKGSFHRDNNEYEKVVSMDQVSMTDVDGTLGIGNFRYALVICKISEDYWDFIPLKTLESGEADKAFREFCGNFTKDIGSVMVYCDAHRSLIRVCDNFSLSRTHPPPGRPQANSVIERKVGVALAGLRAYLVTAGAPNCFWLFAGHCFAFNSQLRRRNGEPSSYEH